MSKYYVIKSTDKETKGIIYFKRYLGNCFTSVENLANAKLFSNYETAKKHMECIKNDDPRTPYIDEIIEVEVDQFGNVVEIEGGNEMSENKKTPQDVRNQGELKEKCVNCELIRKQFIRKDESKYLAEIILHRMNEKRLPLSVLEEALVIVEEKFKESATLTI